jgi:hypothetical protein
MSKYITFDVDHKNRCSAGVCNNSGWIDTHPTAIIDTEDGPRAYMTSRTWARTSITIHPETTLDQIEQDIMALLVLVYRDFEGLRRFAQSAMPSNEDNELAFEARRRAGLVVK